MREQFLAGGRPAQSTARPTKTVARRRERWFNPKDHGLPNFKVFSELPGAVFVRRVDEDDLRHAKLMQGIRQAYESSDCQATLWHALTEMGWGCDEIRQAVLNPATLTRCCYNYPIGGMSRYAAEVADSLMD
jgi:hypothetical protein